MLKNNLLTFYYKQVNFLKYSLEKYLDVEFFSFLPFFS
ncbi:hypothetical protein pah_c032o021 [Parachlamydia acanthamoebae str. Hall's coccus]|nr:hypothetical protein pah_c032o021 [Parachlamydia acanthamoebae str. Hall's coccus]